MSVVYLATFMPPFIKVIFVIRQICSLPGETKLSLCQIRFQDVIVNSEQSTLLCGQISMKYQICTHQHFSFLPTPFPSLCIALSSAQAVLNRGHSVLICQRQAWVRTTCESEQPMSTEAMSQAVWAGVALLASFCLGQAHKWDYF